MTINLRDVRCLLIDMDGVLYRGKTALAGGADLLAFLDAHGISYLLVTNNSTLSPDQFAERLNGMGIPIAEERIMNSGVATAEYLSTLAPAGTKVNVVGEQGLVRELEKRGFVMAGRDAAYVVVGWDRHITFEKLATATLAIRAGATFIGTNPDKTYPLENDIIPGAGAIIAAVAAASGVEPTVVGKPEPIALQLALKRLGARPEETAILGDRLDTDILGGKRAGLITLMVLTGIHTLEDVATSDVLPDRVFDNLPQMLTEWSAALDGAR
jgi:4-nitrophenyl phosphatase